MLQTKTDGEYGAIASLLLLNSQMRREADGICATKLYAYSELEWLETRGPSREENEGRRSVRNVSQPGRPEVSPETRFQH